MSCTIMDGPTHIIRYFKVLFNNKSILNNFNLIRIYLIWLKYIRVNYFKDIKCLTNNITNILTPYIIIYTD